MSSEMDRDGVEEIGPSGDYRSGTPLFFSTPELNQCLDLLLHLIGNSDLLPLLTGDEGAGKTTLLFRLQSKVPEDWSLCRVDAHPMLHFEQLFSQLAAAFGVTEEDDRLVDHLLRRFETLSHAGSVPVIAVDDAHLLPVETIAALLQLHQQCVQEVAGARIVLFAAPQIDQLLAVPEIQTLNFSAFHVLKLLPFSREQTRAFVTHLLAADDRLQGSQRLSDAQVDKIHRESFGSPGRIEYLVTRLILQGGFERPAPAAARDWRQLMRDIPPPWLAAGGGVLLLLLVLLFQDAINALFSAEPEGGQAAVDEPVAVPLALPSETALEPAEAQPPLPPESELVEEPELLEEPQDQEAAAVEAEEMSAEAEVAPAEAEPALSDADVAPIVLAIDEVVNAKAEPAPVPDPLPEATAAPASEAASVPAEPKQVASEPPAERPAVEKAAPVVAEAPAPVVPKAAPAAPKKAAPAAVFAHREDWLRQQKPTAYTLQLLALQDERAMRKYIEVHRLQGKVAYFQTQRQGQPWFSLVYGIYPDRKTALAAISFLPPDLNRKSVWLRSMESVHKAIGDR